jgi:hypothetical protein
MKPASRPACPTQSKDQKTSAHFFPAGPGRNGHWFCEFLVTSCTPGPEPARSKASEIALSLPRRSAMPTLRIEFLRNRLETFARFTTLIWRKEHWNSAFKTTEIAVVW